MQLTGTTRPRSESSPPDCVGAAPWRLDYDFSAQPGAHESLIRELATLRFVDDIANA